MDRQARYDGDSQYYGTDSSVKTVQVTVKHNVDLLISVSDSKVPWGTPTSFTASLRDKTNHSAPISEAVIKLEGTGAKNLTNNQKTNANGKAVWRGIAPSIVDDGWTVQARYDGDSRYSGVNSLAKTYSSNVTQYFSLFKCIPIKVEPRDKYAITGILNDEITDSELPGRKVSFMADLPVIIGDILTDSSGNYALTRIQPARTFQRDMTL